MVSILGLSRITENPLGIEFKRAVREQYERFAPSVVLIED